MVILISSHQAVDDGAAEAEAEARPLHVAPFSPLHPRSKLLAYFKAEDLPKIYGGRCECEGGCVLGRAASDVRFLSSADTQSPSALTDIISLPNRGVENVGSMGRDEW